MFRKRIIAEEPTSSLWLSSPPPCSANGPAFREREESVSERGGEEKRKKEK